MADWELESKPGQLPGQGLPIIPDVMDIVVLEDWGDIPREIVDTGK